MSPRMLVASVLALLLAAPPALAVGAPRQSSRSAERAFPRDVELLKRYVTSLPAGSVVRVRLLTGERFRGTLMGTDANAVVVRPKTRIAEPERNIAFDALDFIELDSGGGGRGTAVLIGVGSAVATFVSLWVVALALVND